MREAELAVGQSASLADEREIVSRAAAGDTRAFEQIMRRYNQRLYRLAVSLLGDPAEAEDALQESYVRAFFRLSSFAQRSSVGAWLAQIVRNEAIDRLRARKSRASVVPLDVGLPRDRDSDLPGEGEVQAEEGTWWNPEASVARGELRAALERAIGALPPDFRAVFMLREVEGLSVAETAEYLDIPAATVKTRDHRARALLRASLNAGVDRATKEAFAFLGARCDALVRRVMSRIVQ